MTRKRLFVLNAVIAAGYGIALLVAAHPILDLHGITPNPEGVYMARWFGVELLAIGLVTWLARNAAASAQKLVDAALREVLVPYAGPELVGISCLAGGPDQLFARAVLDLGGVLEVVVPAEHYRDGLEREEQDGYDELIATAGRLETLPFVESTSEAHLAGGQTIVDRCDLLVAVWDGQPSRGLGGSADTVAYARDRGVPVTVVWPHGATRES